LTSSSTRSIASVYWIRSLVRSRRTSAWRAAAAPTARGRHFDHRAERYLLRHRLAFGCELHARGFDQRLRLTEFLHVGNHRQHDVQIAVRRGAQQGARLRAEQLGFLQTQPDCA